MIHLNSFSSLEFQWLIIGFVHQICDLLILQFCYIFLVIVKVHQQFVAAFLLVCIFPWASLLWCWVHFFGSFASLMWPLLIACCFFYFLDHPFRGSLKLILLLVSRSFYPYLLLKSLPMFSANSKNS